MSWVAVAIVGGSVVGGLINNEGMRNASNAQRDAANSANATQKYMFDQTRADQEPWRNAGRGALDLIMNRRQRITHDGKLEDYYEMNKDFNRDFTMKDFQADPGYQFRLQEGQKAIENSAAARGGLNSGATMKALAKYGQGVAADEYQNAYNRFNNDRTGRFNRIASLAGIGQTANNQLTQAGQNYANQVSQNQIGVGNSQAALQMGQANNMNNMIGTGMNSWMNYNMMNKLAQPQKPPGMGHTGPSPYDDYGSAGSSYANYGNIA